MTGIDHFVDGANSGNVYAYDENGNLTLDPNQALSGISNH